MFVLFFIILFPKIFKIITKKVAVVTKLIFFFFQTFIHKKIKRNSEDKTKKKKQFDVFRAKQKIKNFLEIFTLPKNLYSHYFC